MNTIVFNFYENFGGEGKPEIFENLSNCFKYRTFVVIRCPLKTELLYRSISIKVVKMKTFRKDGNKIKKFCASCFRQSLSLYIVTFRF